MSFGFGVGDFFTILKLANDVRKRISDAPEDFKVLDAEVRNLSITLQDVDIWLHTASAKQKESASIVLEECDTLLRQLQELLEKSTELQMTQGVGGRQELRRKFRRLRISVTWDSSEIKSFQLRIISNITKLNNIGQRRIQVDLDGLVAHKDYQQRSELVEWITPHDYATQQRDILCKRVDQSASQWLLESKQFSAWLEGPGKTLFCPGIPGAGKTMTTAIVADHLLSKQESHSLTAFLYCSYRSQEQQSHDQLIASVLRSLVQQLSRPPDLIQHLFDTQGRLGRPITTQHVLSAVKSISASIDRVNVLIDALDELPRQTRNEILATVLRLQTETGLSLFLTSRHNAGIEETIHPDPALTIEIRAAPEDVQKYLRANLSRLPRCVSGKDEIQEEIVRGISEVVDGMFLLAELHLDSLKNKTSVKEIRTALLKLSSGSNAYADAYNEAWRRIIAQPEEHKNLAKQTIAILVTARRPLSVEELCHALSVDTENEQVDDEEDLRSIEDILATCAGLVTTDPGSNTVRLVHMSAQDHFHRRRAEFFPHAEHILGKMCVTYRRIKSSDPGHAPFYDYADKNWWSHLRQATTLVDQELSGSDSTGETQSTHGLAQSKLAVELSVRLGIEMFSSDPTLYEVTRMACRSGNQSLLEGFLDITHLDLTRNSELLLVAVEQGHKDIMETLLNRGANPNNSELLNLAIQEEHEDILKTLLSRGANPNLYNSYDCPIIFEAIRVDSPTLVQTILDCKGDVELRDRYGDQTPLLWAVTIGGLSCLELLLKVADVDATTQQGQGVLTLAIRLGKIKAVRILLRCPRVNVLQCDMDGRSPLWWAVYMVFIDVVTTLLENSQIKASVQNGVNERILHEAVARGHLDAVRLLLGYDVVTHNCCRLIDGLSPLHCAVRPDKYVRDSIFEGVHIYVNDDAGLPRRAILKLLLKSGHFDVNAADGDGMTALHHLCTFSTTKASALEVQKSGTSSQEHVVDQRGLLLDLWSANIDLDAVDHMGETALHKVLKTGDTFNFNMLMAMGASINVKGAKKLICINQECVEYEVEFRDRNDLMAHMIRHSRLLKMPS